MSWAGAVAILALTGCRPSSPAANDASTAGATVGGTLVFGRADDANTLDPIHTDIGEAVKVIVNVFDTLITYGEDSLELEPALATEWKSSDDGLQWVFALREGVRFHDGTPLTAEAVVLSMERLIRDKHPAVFEAARPYRPSFSMIADVQATGPLEVTFTLATPSAIFLRNLAMFPASIVSPAGIERHGKTFGSHPVGTGPFRFSKWKREEQIVLEAFDEHWRGRPRVDRVVFVPIAETATRIQQLVRGEVHIVNDIPPQELPELERNSDVVLQHQSGLNVGYLALHTEKKPLDNRLVRQAIWHALDKQELIRVAYSGLAAPAVSVVPPVMWGHHEGLQDRPFDPQKAARMLKEAAAQDGFPLPISLSLAVMAQSRPYFQQPLRVASFIKDGLEPIGIKVQIEVQPVNEHFEKLSAGRFQMGLAGWMTDNSDPDNFMYSLLDPDNISEFGNNLSRYRNEDVHQLLLAGQREQDNDQRLTQYRRAQELVYDDVPVIPLVHVPLHSAQRAQVRGYRLHPSSLVFLRGTYFEGRP